MPGSGSERLEPPIPYGRYELLDRIGIGGMAEVFRARLRGPEGFQKIVVVKRALPHVAEDALGVRGFVEEAKLAARIHHDGITQILDLDRGPDGLWFIAMEHVDGIDLSQLLAAAERRALRVPPWLSLYVAADVLDALAYVHELTGEAGEPLGVVHRDVTPSNVIVSHLGRIKLADFGIAQFIGKSTTTLAGQIKGKPSYMSPEQLNNETIDRRADLFTVGVWLWECLTQRRLFTGRDPLALLLEIAEGERRPPSAFARDVPDDADAIVLTALATDRRARFETARDMRRAVLGAVRRLHPNVEREDVARAVSALLGKTEPTKELGGQPILPRAASETGFVILEEEPDPEAHRTPPRAPVRHAPPPPPMEDDLDTLRLPANLSGLYLRRKNRPERVLPTWELAVEALFGHAKDGTPGEISADRERWLRVEEFAPLAGVDLASSDATLASNITIVGSVAARTMIATLAVLARDRASGTLAAARTDPVTGEWYEIFVREGLLARVATNVPPMQVPAVIARERLAGDDEILAILREVAKTRRPIDQVLPERSRRAIHLGALSRLRLVELFRWPSADYTFNATVPSRAERSSHEAPLLRHLAAIVARAIDEDTLRSRIGDRARLRLSRSWRFENAIAEMDLGREERLFAERLAAGATIERTLARASPEEVHRLLALAYVLLEADLLLAGHAWA